MARIIDSPVPVRTQNGHPCAFFWRGRWRRVQRVLETWVYAVPWWEAAQTMTEPCLYFRVQAEDGLYELSQRPSRVGNSSKGRWHLHKVYD